MIETEITAIPPLTPAQLSTLNCHSLLNIYNVIRAELVAVGQQLGGDPALLEASLAACDERVRRVTDPAAALADAARDHDFETALTSELDRQIRQHPRRAVIRAVVSARSNLDTLLWILRVRTRELLARATAPGRWTHVSISELEADFQEWLRGVELTSAGRVRFVRNLALQEKTDYYLDLKFESARGTTVTLPPILKDVLRDLIANARKYTMPGGEIRAAVHVGVDGIRIVVADTGRGIPPRELEEVVHYGRRGTNAVDVRTLGAGCGLTKAFVVTRQLGGRFWIGSELGRGTRVRLWVPAQRHALDAPRPMD